MSATVDSLADASALPVVDAGPGAFIVNGRSVPLPADPRRRLSEVLRDDCGLTGTKVGCSAGDCGACTVLLDDAAACACLVPVGQVAGRQVTTIEGLAAAGSTADGQALGRLQQAFVDHGAAQCGICTPGMLMAAEALLRRDPTPDAATVREAIGGVLCRCTGYLKIVEAVLAAAAARPAPLAVAATAAATAVDPVGRPVARLDGPDKVTGRTRFGADRAPDDALWLRTVRSPHPHARFRFGDLARWRAARPGIAAVLTAADVPSNRFAVFAELRDQPVLAEGVARYRGEAVAGIVGTRDAVATIDPGDFPIDWEPLAPLLEVDEALAATAVAVQPRWVGNVLCRGRVVSGDVDAVFERPSLVTATLAVRTAHVEHAYLEPEAGYAEWRGGRLHVFACTQTPYLDRDELAAVMAVAPEQVRIEPSAIGGGFGGKLDLSLQPLLAVAARVTGRAVRTVWERGESMLATTKRHPARMRARAACDRDGRLVAFDFHGDFNTGPYASWGPTVANRVPIHACGPYRVPNVRTLTRAVLTHDAIGGAFRGFGVPQAAIVGEALIDELAAGCRIDPFAFRLRNALRAGDRTATGQRLDASVGLVACLEALAPAWQRASAAARCFNAAAADDRLPGDAAGARAADTAGARAADTAGARALDTAGARPLDTAAARFVAAGPDPLVPAPRRARRRGVGVACMWYGIGNTVIANPSTMRAGLRPDGRVMLYNGAQEIGQGTATIMPQILGEALGVPVSRIDQVHGDTDRTADAGKSSASRQTFVSGQATLRAGRALKAAIVALAAPGSAADAAIELGDGSVRIDTGEHAVVIDLRDLPRDADGDVCKGEGYFDPPTVPLDADGQGVPYATYGFAAQVAEVDVDIELGTVRLLHLHAAHDVGRVINPVLTEGQIHGGIAQGIGLALMEEYRSGRTDNLHDYLIPGSGDVPPITIHLVEDPEPLGPYGAKGVGEPALVATAPAILNAIHDATGVRLLEVPALPHRVLAALRAARPEARQ